MERRQPSLSRSSSPDEPGTRALIGLRGVAALLVMSHHFVLRQDVSVPGLRDLLWHGYLAVDLFFVLSGFVMARAYGHWFTGEDGWRSGVGAYLEFMLRRVARLWPLHTAVVLALLVHRELLGQGNAWPRMIASNVLMVQAWGFTQALNTPSWSVSTEMAAYLAFPLLAAAALHGGRLGAWITFAGAVGALTLAATLAPPLEYGRRGLLDIHDNWSVLPALRCIGGFTIGLLAYRAAQGPRTSLVLRHPACAMTAMSLLLSGLLSGVPDVVLYPLLPLLVAALQVGRGPLQDALGSAVPVTAGLLSYALYLVHYPILGAIPLDIAPAPARFLVFVLVSAAVAAAAHWAIERPGRRALRRLGQVMHTRLARLLPG